VNLCGCLTVMMSVFYPLSIMYVFYTSFLGLSYYCIYCIVLTSALGE